MPDEHAKVSSRHSAPPALELGESGAHARGAGDVNPFVGVVCALDSEGHSKPQSNPRAGCRRCGGRDRGCLSCLASVLARKHGGDDLNPSSAPAASGGDP
jgi:hypothetical protein